MNTILITGGSGLIGTALTNYFTAQGNKVKHLVRSKRGTKNVEEYIWNPDQLELDENAFEGVNVLINLAGANVGDGRWTEKKKKEILDSRVNAIQTLTTFISKKKHSIKHFVSASAVGYYGLSEEKLFNETDVAGNDFLAEVTKKWEESTSTIQSLLPTTILRIGVVLCNEGGAFVEMKKPIDMYIGSALGSGNQSIPWVSMKDVVGVMNWVIENKKTGIYNLVAPNPVSNKKLMQAIAEATKKPLWPIDVPPFVLKLALGEQSQIVLNGSKVSSEKLANEGYQFDFESIESCVKFLCSSS